MEKILFIFGAGASAEGGAPLMGNFLDKANKILFDKKISLRNRDDFKRVFGNIDKLRNGQIEEKLNKEIDWNNIESVFSVFEEIQSIEDLAISPEDKKSLLPSLKGLIFETLAQSIIFPHSVRKDVEYRQPPYPYGLFATLLDKIKGDPKYNISLITFNYDISLDYALNLLCLPYGYSLDGDYPTIPLLKPHGSLNWAICDKCGRISHITFAEYGQRYFNSYQLNEHMRKMGREPQIGKNMHLEMFNLLNKHECPYCRVESLSKPIFCKEEPFIIAPVKSKNYEKLQTIHNKVEEEIISADYIYIIGYSFPESDNYIRRYIENAERYERMILINPDGKSLGNQFEYHNYRREIRNLRFGESIITIAKDLDLDFTEIIKMADYLGFSIGTTR